MFQTEIRIPFFSPVSGLRGCFSVNGTDLYKPVCSQNLELVNLVPESRLPFSTYIVPFTLKRTGRPETGIKYLNERGEGISFFALFGLRNIKQRNPGPISPVSHPFRTLTSADFPRPPPVPHPPPILPGFLSPYLPHSTGSRYIIRA